ncbi:hypothetical protein CHELA40_20030 [Chelatococcus asaccharovorans]|nr:hypothetical protein CHELA17_10021 [Chelatococcus asaccharovorans]CAH1687225.1 hypothetical protein CHELA40_20030 [Chelatococcus asaccharovorans]
MFAQAGLLALLTQDALQACAQAVRQNHVSQANVGIARMQQSGEFALRLNKGHRPTILRNPGVASLRRIDKVLKLLSQLAMALTRLVRGKLHRGGEETILVAGNMALEQRHDVAGGGHSFLLGVSD